MCGQKAAIRRRKQAANNYMHMAPQDRPHYARLSASKAAAKLARIIANERKCSQKKKAK